MVRFSWFILFVTPVAAAAALTSSRSAAVSPNGPPQATSDEKLSSKPLMRRHSEDEQRPGERHETGARPSIAIVSMCIDKAHDYWKAKVGGYDKYTMENHRRYAAQHGYEYLVKTSDTPQNQ